MRRTWPQRLLMALNVVVAAACIAAALAINWTFNKLGEIQRVEFVTDASGLGGLSSTDDGGGPSGQAENFLVVGSDSRVGLDANSPWAQAFVAGGYGAGGENTDTIMVIRVDPTTDKVSLLSIPRDLWVPIPHHGNQRINAAYAIGNANGANGGPQLLVDTIKQNLNIPIHHFIEVGFQAFRDIVDAVGGVAVPFAYPARDTHSGFLAAPGCQTLTDYMALAYARSRYYEELRNGKWVSDGLADYGRVSRQQDFVRRAMKKALSVSGRDPQVMARLLSAAVKNVKLDQNLTLGSLLSVANHLHNFDPDTVAEYQLPTRGEVIGGADVLQLVTAQAEPILDVFRGLRVPESVSTSAAGDAPSTSSVAPTATTVPATVTSTPTPIAPSSIRLEVENGAGTPGLASQAASALRARGFQVTRTANAEPGVVYPRSVIRFTAEQEPQAEAVRSWLGGDADFQQVNASTSGTTNAALVLILGSGFTGVLSQAVAPTTSAETATTTTNTAPSAQTSTTPATVVASQPKGFVPDRNNSC